MDPRNPDLIRAIHEVAVEDTPASRRALYRALLASHLLVPIQNAVETAPEEPIRATVVLYGESKALPAFTDWEALALWPDRAIPATFIEFKGQGVFILARGIDMQYVLINPSGPVGIPIGSTEIQILGDGALPGQREAGFTPIQVKELICLGPPRTPVSADLVERMQKALQVQRHVKRAFLFEGSSGGPSRICVGVEFSRRVFGGRPSLNEIEVVMRAVGKALEGHLGDHYIDGIVLDGPLLDSVKHQVPAFFSSFASK